MMNRPVCDSYSRRRGFFSKFVRLMPLCILLLLITVPAIAQSALSAATASLIDQIVEKARTEQKLPAVAVAVSLKGKIIFSKAYGFADLENNVPATTQTLIRTASVAKPMTAVGALELVEQGKLDLNAPIQKYCPQFPVKKWPITTRELLGHLSGIRWYEGKETESTVHYHSTVDGMIIFKDDPLVAPPGEKYNYSTYGYTVVGCVMEGASGEKYPQYMVEHVFRPAGMTHTIVDDFAIVPHRASGYEKDENGNVINARLMDSSYKIPGGGFVSNAEDLVRFANAVMTDKLLKLSTVEMMWTSQKTTDGKETHYGLGWGISELEGIRIVAHTGGQQGTSTSLLAMPSRDYASAVMINMQYIDAAQINRTITRVVVDAEKLR
jgi:serine beta-lactamase-like protein LACTB, mitochondrial